MKAIQAEAVTVAGLSNGNMYTLGRMQVHATIGFVNGSTCVVSTPKNMPAQLGPEDAMDLARLLNYVAERSLEQQL